MKNTSPNNTIKLLTASLFLLSITLFSQKTYKNFALINCYAHLGNGKVIEQALITVKNGTIESVNPIAGIKLNHTAFDTVIDLEDKHVYPALINANNVLGLHDAFSVRATRDLQDVGKINPHIRTLIAYNSDNKITPTIKTNGILYTQVTPRGGLISGNSSVMALEGWNWEDAVLKADDGIHLNFPVLNERNLGDEGAEEKAMNRYKEEQQELVSFMDNAYAYFLNPDNSEKNLRFEAMRGVFDGTKNLYIHADKAKDILTAIQFCAKLKIKKPVFVGAKQAYKILPEIKQSAIPVMLVRVHDLPDRADEDIDAVFKLPATLFKAGIFFCLQTEGDTEMEAMNSRNLPFLAGSAVSYGLPKEEAISAITLNTAKILGVDKQIGSLEEGKLASLIVSEGDIMDMKSSTITHAFIAGRPVNLMNQQTELYLKYKTKYGLK
jgi:imidazolonepropionase-like amidohydrolase